MIERRRRDSGVVLILVAIVSLVLLVLIALAIATGALSLAKTRHQNLANVVALAALKGYVESDTGLTHQQRLDAGVERANELLAKNEIPGMDEDLPELGLESAQAPGGTVIYGNYYPEMLDGVNPCELPAEPPCFVPSAQDPDTPSTAVRVQLATVDTDDFIFDIGRLLGKEEFDVESSATASLAERCVFFLLDGSRSSTSQTHRQVFSYAASCAEGTGGGTGVPCTPVPPYIQPVVPEHPAQYLYRASAIGVPPMPCNYDSLNQPQSPEFHSWCLLGEARRSGDTYRADERFRSDFSLRDTVYGPAYVDTFAASPPEPLTSYYSAFNTMLRNMREAGNPIDRAGMLVFGSSERDLFPLDTDYGPLIQLTNMENLGSTGFCPSEFQTCIPELPPSATNGQVPVLSGEQIPNFVGRGHIAFGNDASGSTNLPYAFITAIDQLSDCPATSKKMIVLASDGESSCYYDAREANSYYCNAQGRPPFTAATHQLFFSPYSISSIGGNYNGAAEQQIMSNWPFVDPQSGDWRNVTQELVARRISVTVFMAGDYLRLNFRNVPKPGGGFYSFAEAAALGYHGLNPNNPYNHAPYFPGQEGQFQWFVNPANHQNNPPYPAVPGHYTSDNWKEYSYLMHSEFEAKYGTPNWNGSPPYHWWSDFNTWAYTLSGVIPGVFNGRPAAELMEMSLRTGGVFAQLMPQCHEIPGKNPDPNHWYECPIAEIGGVCPVARKLKDERRNHGTGFGGPNNTGRWQNCAVHELPQKPLAEQFGLEAIGQNVYMLVEDQ